MARRSKQLDAEIAAALAKGSPHPEATVSDWKKVIAGIQNRARMTSDAQHRAILQEELAAAQLGLQAAGRTAAMKPSFVTGTNLFALTQLIVKHGGPEFPNRLESVDRPHIKRTLDAGLVEIAGNKLRLTSAGREAVGDEIIKELAREGGWKPNILFVPNMTAEARAEVTTKEVAKHDAKIQRLEHALANLKR